MEEQNTKELEKCVPIFDVPMQAQGHGYGSEPGDEPDSGLLDYWRMIRLHKGTVLLITFLGGLAAVLFTLPQTPIYQAGTVIEVQELNEGFLNMRDSVPVSDGIYSTMADIQTQIRILQSNSVLQSAMAKMKVKSPGGLKQATGRISAWRKALNLPEPPPKDAMTAALDAARGSVKAKASGQTRIIDLTCDSTDPAIAADFCNMVANEFIEQNVETRWKMSQRTGDWLSKQLDDMRIRLERSEDGLQAYARQSGLMFLGDKEKLSVSEEKFRQLQQELSKAAAERVGRQSKWEIVRMASPETLPDVLNDPSLREYQTKLTDLRRQEAELATTYQPEYTKIKRIRAQIAPIEAALERERKAITSRIKNEYDEAMGHERMLTVDYATQAKLVTGETEKTIQYDILKHEVDSNRQIYDSTLQKVKESAVSSAMRTNNIRVVDTATPPGAPYKPDVSRNGLMGLLAGLFLGVAFVVMHERADGSIQEPGDTALYLNVPEMGVISSGAAKGDLLGYYHERKRSPKTPVAIAPGTGGVGRHEGAGPDQMELVTWQRKMSAIAESFRGLLTSILFSGENGSPPRVLVLTSAEPAEGKTTVACNLAIAMAEIKQRVLLIDGDLRKPRIHTIFDLENERGLSTLLEQRPLQEETMAGVVQESRIPGLFVLTSGPTTAAAANLLHSASLVELLGKFRKEFDMILIDTPPMLQIPDARVAGRLADAVILIVRARRTKRNAAVAARTRFAEDKTRVLGTILNDRDHPPRWYHRYYSRKAYQAGYERHAG